MQVGHCQVAPLCLNFASHGFRSKQCNMPEIVRRPTQTTHTDCCQESLVASPLQRVHWTILFHTPQLNGREHRYSLWCCYLCTCYEETTWQIVQPSFRPWPFVWRMSRQNDILERQTPLQCSCLVYRYAVESIWPVYLRFQALGVGERLKLPRTTSTHTFRHLRASGFTVFSRVHEVRVLRLPHR